MKKGLILSFFVILFSLSMTGCSAIDGVLDTFVNHSKLTIEYDYTHHFSSGGGSNYIDYKDLMITFADQEYVSIGSYQVPNNTTVHITWLYRCDNCALSWQQASKDIHIGSFENVQVVINHDNIEVYQ